MKFNHPPLAENNGSNGAKETTEKITRVQAEILKRVTATREARIAWIDKNGKTFRELFESDPEFRQLVMEEKIDEVIEYIEKRRNQ